MSEEIPAPLPPQRARQWNEKAVDDTPASFVIHLERWDENLYGKNRRSPVLFPVVFEHGTELVSHS